VVGRFNGGEISSDGGGLLLREVEQRTHILRRLSACFTDRRDPARTEHGLATLIRQRVFGIALGYEDLVDHDELCRDRLLALLCGVSDVTGSGRIRASGRGRPLAGKSTLNRLELTAEAGAGEARYKKVVSDFAAMDALLADVFVESYETAPEEIILDADATGDPAHGHQAGRFFHGYCRHYCYLPLYIFCGEQLLCARLRTADRDGAAGTAEEMARIVERIRARWPGVRIIVRGDSGFCREALMSWCEAQGVEYVLGLAKNDRLKSLITAELAQAKARQESTGEAARVFKECRYRTRSSWSCARRVVGKAEYLSKGANPRFVVTSLPVEAYDARTLYEALYCARGDMENRIREQQLALFADRTSTHELRANRLRLYFSSFACVLMQALRRLALQGAALARAQCDTLRLKLLKVGVQVRLSVRKVWLAFAEGYPYAGLFYEALTRLQAIPVRT
jgi:hypothetical protein